MCVCVYIYERSLYIYTHTGGISVVYNKYTHGDVKKKRMHLLYSGVWVKFLSYHYIADKSTIFGMRGLWGLTINSGRGATLKYLQGGCISQKLNGLLFRQKSDYFIFYTT